MGMSGEHDPRVDGDADDEGSDARGVLAAWLDDYIGGRCDRAEMHAQFLAVCRGHPDAPWDALALLDQYQRRGRIDTTLARALKADVAQFVFGAAQQTEAPRPAPDAVLDTTGSRWRKLLAERNPRSINAVLHTDVSGAESTLLRRDQGPLTRPPTGSLTGRVSDLAGDRIPGSDGVLRDRYDLISVLGRGSTGAVYKALDRHRAHLPAAARAVAIKVLKLDYRDRPEALAELEHEFHQAQSLAHPNIVSVFDLDHDADTWFVVMELLEGELLADVIRDLDGRTMRRDTALAIIGSIGAALAHAHRRNVVHADLKPRNVMLTSGGEVRVLDFGFARRRPLEPHVAGLLHDELMHTPTPGYASAERVNGAPPDPSDDVYSLACIAYELLSGQHPFGGRSAVLARAHGRPPQRIRGLSKHQWQGLQFALRWERTQRQIDAIGLLAALDCAAVPQILPTPDLLAAASPGQTVAWRPIAIAAAVAVALVIAVVGGLRLFRPAGTSSPLSVSTVAGTPIRSETQAVPLQADPAGAAGTGGTAELPPGIPADAAPRAAPAVSAGTGAAATAAADTAAGTVEFDKDTYVVTESDSAVRLVVNRSGSTQRAASFTWALRANSAEAGTDFAAIGPRRETIAAGESSVAVAIPLVSDALTETTELFLVELAGAEGDATPGMLASAAVIIVDDD